MSPAKNVQPEITVPEIILYMGQDVIAKQVYLQFILST